MNILNKYNHKIGYFCFEDFDRKNTSKRSYAFKYPKDMILTTGDYVVVKAKEGLYIASFVKECPLKNINFSYNLLKNVICSIPLNKYGVQKEED